MNILFCPTCQQRVANDSPRVNHVVADKRNASYFPLLLQLDNGKRILCSSPVDIPGGVPFKVLETHCDIEIRSFESKIRG